MYYDPPADSDVGTIDIPYYDASTPRPKDYYEPHADSNVGALERRMLYLVHQLTFKQYFVDRPYTTILKEHRTRVDRTPSTIEFPLGIDETKARLATLIDAIRDAGWQNNTLQELCEMEIDTTSDVWMATENVDEAGIFIPYYHADDKQDVVALFTKGFVDDEKGWGTYKVHALFSTRALDYIVPGHAIRRATVRKAKHLSVIRPRVTLFVDEENYTTMGKGNSHYCTSTACNSCSHDGHYCSTTENNECSLMSDTH